MHDLIASQERANSLNQLVVTEEETKSNLLAEIDSLKRAISQRDTQINLITQGSNEANSQLLDELN